MMGIVRRGAKALLERGLTAGGLTEVLMRRRRDEFLILAYHNIRPDDEQVTGEAALHLPLSQFRAHLDLLQRTLPVVPLGDLLASGGSRGPRVAITFDDAYAGALRYGVPELAARGLPATIFVTPGFLGGRPFWWDTLAQNGVLDAAVRTHALEQLRGMDAAVHAWASEAGLPLSSPAALARGAEESELHAAARVPGIQFGAHTWSHPNLARLDVADLEAELTRPLAWLRERFPNVLPWVSYPYGATSAAVEAAAAQAGYEAGLRVTGGWGRAGALPRYAIPRLNVPSGPSPRGFRLRFAGLTGG